MQRISLLKRIHRYVANCFSGRNPDAGYRYRTGDVVIEDFAEFSETSLDFVIERIGNSRRINAADWNALQATSFSERAATFYEASQNYVFDTLSANPNPEAVIKKLDTFNPKILQVIRAHPGKRFLEFGGGVGVFCEIVARMGKQVSYMELPGIVFDFARWRFKKLGLNLKAIEAKADTIYLTGKYDIVYTDAVLEHLPQPLQLEATRALARAVATDGLLIFLVDLSGPSKENPMHHNVNIVDLHSQLRSEGLCCEDGDRKFCSIWRRPAPNASESL
jgi:protein-L-isoaspartate O-methyltransferase